MGFKMRKSKAVSDAVYDMAQAALKKGTFQGLLAVKLQAIIAAKHHTITQVAKLFNRTRTTILNWIQRFSQDAIEGLKVKPGRGPKSRMSEGQKEELRQFLTKNPFVTAKQIQEMMRENWGFCLSSAAIYVQVKKLGFSYQTPRPRHHLADPEKQKAFKKNWQRCGKKIPTSLSTFSTNLDLEHTQK